MFRRILLDDETWLVTVGLLGGIRVYYKPLGRLRKVHSGERRHLYDIVNELRKAGAPLDGASEQVTWVLREFTERVLLRGDVQWRRFFIDRSAREIAAEALAANPAPARAARLQTRQVPLGRLWKRLWLSATPANLRLLLPLRNRAR